jgi:hypothetical protein
MEITLPLNPKQDELVVPEKCLKCVRITFWLFLLVAIYAVWKRVYDIGIVSFAIFVTSILFWSNPTYGFRRNMDITVVSLSMLYITIKVLRSKMSKNIIMVGLAVILLYSISSWMFDQNQMMNSMITHCSLHVVASAGLILLCNQQKK